MTSGDWLTCVLLILATYRITKLIVDDRIARPLRDPLQNAAERRWQRKHPDHPPEKGCGEDGDEWCSSIAYLLSCPWCMSIWVAGALVSITDVFIVGVPLPVLTALAASGVTGFLSGHDAPD